MVLRCKRLHQIWLIRWPPWAKLATGSALGIPLRLTMSSSSQQQPVFAHDAGGISRKFSGWIVKWSPGFPFKRRIDGDSRDHEPWCKR